VLPRSAALVDLSMERVWGCRAMRGMGNCFVTEYWAAVFFLFVANHCTTCYSWDMSETKRRAGPKAWRLRSSGLRNTREGYAGGPGRSRSAPCATWRRGARPIPDGDVVRLLCEWHRIDKRAFRT